MRDRQERWTLDRCHIKNAAGDVIASVPNTLGDDDDHKRGWLIVKLVNAYHRGIPICPDCGGELWRSEHKRGWYCPNGKCKGGE